MSPDAYQVQLDAIQWASDVHSLRQRLIKLRMGGAQQSSDNMRELLEISRSLRFASEHTRALSRQIRQRSRQMHSATRPSDERDGQQAA